MLPVEKTRSIYASFFFVDIVGLSDPELSVVLQVRKIERLNDTITHCKAFESAPSDSVLYCQQAMAWQ